MSGGRSDRTVAVIGTSAGAESSLRRYATLIEDLAGTRAQVLVLDPDAPQEIVALLPAGVGALFLPDTPPEVACRVRALARVPVLTGQDTTAIALAAAVSATLARAGRVPRSSQVMIAGAAALPVLCPLLMISGVGTVTTWNHVDAHAFPLYRVASGTDVVIDLLGALNGMDGVGPVVILPDHERDTALALPGLVRAMVQTPGARLDVNVHHACALALVMGTPPDELLPHQPDRELTDRIAAAAAAALRAAADHSLQTNQG